MDIKTFQGVAVPVLGFGTYRLMRNECQQAVESALESGYRHIDTAPIYKNEAEVGAGLKGAGIARQDLFITSKIWPTDLDSLGVRKSAESSLKNLGTDYVDLMLIHWPNPLIPLEETLQALTTLREAGRVRHIGVSNFPSALLEKAIALESIFSIQVEYHPLLGQEKILRVAKAHDIMVAAYAPLGRGTVLDEPKLREIGVKYAKTAGQIALKWLCDQPQVVALPKATSRDHQQANLDIFDFELSSEDRAQIDALPKNGRLINPSELAPEWDD